MPIGAAGGEDPKIDVAAGTIEAIYSLAKEP